ncbi:hypothetical protein [Flavobacterium aquicola]|uniref:hypothetical protein n=1 Tax=Flavobacterium aquicola TaxID=1682742 RepID=UPI000E23A214|nr:hypothetical protein [Flavobacterium aquicola]
MQHITGISRHQMRISSLEEAISPDNQVRFIDAFVSIVDLSKLGFTFRLLKRKAILVKTYILVEIPQF